MAKPERVNSGAGFLAGDGSGRVSISATLLCVVLMVSCVPKSGSVVLIPDDYDTWGRTTGVQLDYPIPGHEDNFRIIYMNDIGFGYSRTVEGQAGQVVFPAGTVIAKAIYESSAPAPGATPMMVTAMIKDPDNPAAKGGWVWLTKNLALGKETVIKGDFCFTCHANANEAHPYGDRNPDEGFRDFVFFIPGIP